MDAGAQALAVPATTAVVGDCQRNSGFGAFLGGDEKAFTKAPRVPPPGVVEACVFVVTIEVAAHNEVLHPQAQAREVWHATDTKLRARSAQIGQAEQLLAVTTLARRLI